MSERYDARSHDGPAGRVILTVQGLCAAAAAAAAAVAGAGCAAPPAVVSVPVSAAVTNRNEKAVGLAEFANLTDQGLTPALIPFTRTSTLAQSGEGLLGDRLFRENEHGLIEGCRWVQNGRTCNLVTLPDGKYLGGGGAHWIVRDGAAATPRAGGWVVSGTVPTVIPAGDSILVHLSMPAFSGKVLHCRFSDAGPTCISATLAPDTTSYIVLGVLSLRDGEASREVLWVGAVVPRAEGFYWGPPDVKAIYRCETSEESTDIKCQIATLR